MKYLCLIYSAPGTEPTDDSSFRALMQRWYAFNDEVEAAGVLLGGEPLETVDTATTVRNRDGKTLITDGPFAETKEHLGGYYLLDCKDLDEALGFAAKIPAADYGSIEVRPLMDLPSRD